MIHPGSDAPVDFMRQPITVGRVIVYPVRRGSAMWLNRLTVQQIDQAGNAPVIVGYAPNGRRVRVKNTENCVVVR